MASMFVRSAAKKVFALSGCALGIGAGMLYSRTPTAPATMGSKDGLRKAYVDFKSDEDYPDLSKHNNCLANWLTKGMYEKLRDVVSDVYLSYV